MSQSTLGAYRTFLACIKSSEQMSRCITGGNLHGFATCVGNCTKVWQRNEERFVKEFHQYKSFQQLINRMQFLNNTLPLIVVVMAWKDVFSYAEELRQELGLAEVRGCD